MNTTSNLAPFYFRMIQVSIDLGEVLFQNNCVMSDSRQVMAAMVTILRLLA